VKIDHQYEDITIFRNVGNCVSNDSSSSSSSNTMATSDVDTVLVVQ
jgi:carbonic anhydrase